MRKLGLKLVLAVYFCAFVSFLLPGTIASAALQTCRTDPVVYLSDGTIVFMIVSVETNADNLLGVDYIVHVPAGVRATRIVYTDRTRGSNETVQLIEDSEPGVYITDTLVKTAQPGARVVASSAVNGGIYSSVVGSTHQHLINSLIRF